MKYNNGKMNLQIVINDVYNDKKKLQNLLTFLKNIIYIS